MIDRIQGPIFDLVDFIRGEGSLATVAISFFSVLVIIFVSFPIHECCHGLMAKLLGDDTAEREGRLTLNPFAHIDPMGALCMFLFGRAITGSFISGTAEEVAEAVAFLAASAYITGEVIRVDGGIAM